MDGRERERRHALRHESSIVHQESVAYRLGLHSVPSPPISATSAAVQMVLRDMSLDLLPDDANDNDHLNMADDADVPIGDRKA